MRVTKKELKFLEQLADFLDGHELTKSADEVHILVHKLKERGQKEGTT